MNLRPHANPTPMLLSLCIATLCGCAESDTDSIHASVCEQDGARILVMQPDAERGGIVGTFGDRVVFGSSFLLADDDVLSLGWSGDGTARLLVDDGDDRSAVVHENISSVLADGDDLYYFVPHTGPVHARLDR